MVRFWGFILFSVIWFFCFEIIVQEPKPGEEKVIEPSEYFLMTLISLFLIIGYWYIFLKSDTEEEIEGVKNSANEKKFVADDLRSDDEVVTFEAKGFDSQSDIATHVAKQSEKGQVTFATIYPQELPVYVREKYMDSSGDDDTGDTPDAEKPIITRDDDYYDPDE